MGNHPIALPLPMISKPILLIFSKIFSKTNPFKTPILVPGCSIRCTLLLCSGVHVDCAFEYRLQSMRGLCSLCMKFPVPFAWLDREEIP